MSKRWLTVLLSVMVILAIGIGSCQSFSRGGEEIRNVDVVIVGSGIAGAVAALAARDAGAASVLIIEKENHFGGNASTAAGGYSQLHYNRTAGNYLGFNATTYTNTDWPTDMNHADWVAFNDNWMGGMYPRNGLQFPKMDRVRDIFKDVTKTVEYLAGKGVPFTYLHRGTPRRWYAQTTGDGPAMMESLRTAVVAHDIEVILNCEGTRVTKTSGVVDGVLATYNGRTVKITAKKVILATGGFAYATGENGLIARWANNNGWPGLIDVIPSTDTYRTKGEGIVMAVEAGGAVQKADGTLSGNIRDMDSFIYISSPAAHPGITAVSGFANASYVNRDRLMERIVVNARGQRFTDETAIRKSPVNGVEDNSSSTGNGDLANAMIKAGRAPYWVIYDSRSIPVGESNMNTRLSELADISGNNAKANGVWPNGTHRPVATSKAVSGTDLNTHLGALADQMELNAADKAAFIATVNAFNTGGTRTPLNTPPFYAIQIRVIGSTGSIGGVATSWQGELLNPAGTVIPNLFAVGEMANRELYGEGQIGGGSLSMYSTMGRRAGTLAAQQLR